MQSQQSYSLGDTANQQLRNEKQEEQRSLYQIMVDTGAELSVAPKSFADHIQLSSPKADLELRGADGKSISIFGTREVELVTVGSAFKLVS